MVFVLDFSWGKIKIKPHASLDVLKKSDEKQVFFLERPKSKNVFFDVLKKSDEKKKFCLAD